MAMKSYCVCVTLAVFLSIVHFPPETTSAKILNIAFFTSKSHKITYEALLQELAARGHEVTVISPVLFGHKKLREILTFDAEKYFEDEGFAPNMFEVKEKGQQIDPRMFMTILTKLCNMTYNQPHVMDLLKETFDLIIIPVVGNECALGYAYKFNVPFVAVSPLAAPPFAISVLGTPSPVSFVANLFTPYGDRMTFYQRGVNFLVESFFNLMQTFYFKPNMEALYRDKLNDQSLPSSDDIMRERTSLVLSNSHFSLGQPRPFLPDIVEVGGMHLRPAKSLPKDLEDYMNSSGEDGVILFSMGSGLKSSQMSERHRNIFLGAFGKLKQKILWKFEDESLGNIPSNLKISKWLPQQDILGHPKLKAFITHGGLGSTAEAVYHGIPLVMIPMFGDQTLNTGKSVDAGYAIGLEYTELTEEKIVEAVNKIIGTPSYKERVLWLSKLFRDQPDNPLDRAVFWTEYIIRHKGAPHLRSAARDLNFFQYFSLDVICALIATTSVALYLVFILGRLILRKLYYLIFRREAKPPTSAGSKKKNK